VRELALVLVVQSGLSLECIGGNNYLREYRNSLDRNRLPLPSLSHRTDSSVVHRGLVLELVPELALAPGSLMVAGKEMAMVAAHQKQSPRRCRTQRAHQCICTPKATAMLRAQTAHLRATTQFEGSVGQISNDHVYCWHPNMNAHQSIQLVCAAGNTPRFQQSCVGNNSIVRRHCDPRPVQCLPGNNCLQNMFHCLPLQWNCICSQTHHQYKAYHLVQCPSKEMWV
jgi:hypothetical protein